MPSLFIHLSVPFYLLRLILPFDQAAVLAECNFISFSKVNIVTVRFYASFIVKLS